MFGIIDEAAPQLIGPGMKAGKKRLAPQPRPIPGAPGWVADKAQGRTPRPEPVPQRAASASTSSAWSKPITAKPARSAAPPPRATPTWPAGPDNSVWASASTGTTRSVPLPDTPPEQFNADDLTAEQTAERMKRIEFDWAEEMDKTFMARDKEAQVTEPTDEATTNEWTGPAAEDKPDPFAPLATFNPLGGDEDEDDDYYESSFYTVNPAWGIPVLAEEDMKRTSPLALYHGHV